MRLSRTWGELTSRSGPYQTIWTYHARPVSAGIPRHRIREVPSAVINAWPALNGFGFEPPAPAEG